MPVDMSAITFGGDGMVSNAATIAAGYTTSIIAARWLASIIDGIVLVVPALVIPMLPLERSITSLMVWPWLGLLVAYFPVMETCFGGALGKLATGTRVVNLHGGRPAWWQSIVRTLLRLVEVNPFLFGAIPAGLIVLLSGHRQRLGDMLARTYVLRRADIARIRPAGTARAEPVWNSHPVPVPPPIPLPGPEDGRWARQWKQ